MRKELSASLFRLVVYWNVPAENCSFVQILRDRIIACKAFGLWMHAHAIQNYDRKHISSILFVNIDCFAREIEAFSQASDRGSRILYNSFCLIVGFVKGFVYQISELPYAKTWS